MLNTCSNIIHMLIPMHFRIMRRPKKLTWSDFRNHLISNTNDRYCTLTFPKTMNLDFRILMASLFTWNHFTTAETAPQLSLETQWTTLRTSLE